MFKKFGKWYLYAVVGFFAVAIIVKGLGLGDTPESAFKNYMEKENISEMERMSNSNPNLMIDGKNAEEIITEIKAKKEEDKRLAKEEEAKKKAEAEKLAKEETAKKAEAERLAKEEEAKKKAEAEKLAKEETAKKAEAERLAKEEEAIKNFEFNTTFTNKSETEFMGERMSNYTNFKINIKDGKLIIHSKLEGLGQFDYEKIQEIELRKISDALIRQTNSKGVKTNGMKYTTNNFVLELMYFDKDDLTVKDIQNKTEHKSIFISIFSNDIDTLKNITEVLHENILISGWDTYLSKSNKMKIHYAENFTKKVKVLHKAPILCRSKKFAAKAEAYLKVSKDKYIKALEDGKCLIGNQNILDSYIEENNTDEIILIKFKRDKDKNYQYYWTHINEVK